MIMMVNLNDDGDDGGDDDGDDDGDDSGDPLLCEGRRPAHLGAGQMAFQTSKNLRTADEWWLR